MKTGLSPQKAKAGISACDICDHKTCSEPPKSALLYCLFVQGSQILLATEGSEGRWTDLSNLRTDACSIRMPARAAPPGPFQDQERAVWSGLKQGKGVPLSLRQKVLCWKASSYFPEDWLLPERKRHPAYTTLSPKRKEGDLEWWGGAITSPYRVRRTWGSCN